MLALIIAWLTSPSLSGCGEESSPAGRPPRQPPLVEVVEVRRGSIVDELELTGAIEPVVVAKMASPVEGPVVACLVREGDRVRRGQLLVRLGHAESDSAEARAARAELARANLELERAEHLVKTGAIAEEALDDARVKVSDAEAKVVETSARVGYYRVAAPWAGVVSGVPVVVGDYVAARTTLVELFDPESLVLRFAVPERRAVATRKRAPVKVRLDAHPGQVFDGEVSRIYPEIDRESHTRRVEATLDGEVELAPGMFARVEVTLASIQDAITVPLRALLIKGDAEKAVFVVTKAQKVSRRKVRTGIEDREVAQVIEGLEVGERVVVAGQAKLKEGAKVRVRGKGGSAKGKGHGKSGRPSGRAPRPGGTTNGEGPGEEGQPLGKAPESGSKR